MSSIIKSTFVALSEQKKDIESVDINNSRIINNPKEDSSKNQLETGTVVEQKTASKKQDTKAIVDDAKKKADQIISSAKKKATIEADKIKADAKNEGYQQGYDEGKVAGAAEFDSLKQEVLLEKKSLIVEKNNLISTLEKKIATIIKELVVSLIGVYRYNDETIINLIRKGFNEVELYDNMTIRVSRDDYDTVIENKELLTETLSQKVDLEIFKDMNLNNNDCIIETELGNINCSLDLRLNGLINELKLIEKSLISNSREG